MATAVDSKSGTEEHEVSIAGHAACTPSKSEPTSLDGTKLQLPCRAKIVHITTVHSDNDIRIFLKECRSLAKAGYDVVQIAKGNGNSVTDNVRKVGISVPATRFGRVTVGQWHALRAALRERAAIYHFHDPELVVLGIILRLLRRRVIYDAHEQLSTDVLDKDWIPRPLLWCFARLARAIEVVLGSTMNGIVAVTPGVQASYPVGKTIVVRNFPLREEIDAPAVTGELPGEEEPIFVQLGRLNAVRGGHVLAQAVPLIRHPSAKIIIVGGIVEADLKEIYARLASSGRVLVQEWTPRAQALTMVRRARAGLFLGQDVAAHQVALPNKLLEYMASGASVIVSDLPMLREIVQEAGCGILVQANDPHAIARAIDTLAYDHDLAQRMGAAGHHAVSTDLNWDSEAAHLIEFYRRVLAAP